MKHLRDAHALPLAVLAVIVLIPALPSGQEPRLQRVLLRASREAQSRAVRTGAWTTAIAVPEAPLTSHLYTFYVGTRNGGVWKTTNNGTTFEPVFDAQPSLSIGAVEVAPSDEHPGDPG